MLNRASWRPFYFGHAALPSRETAEAMPTATAKQRTQVPLARKAAALTKRQPHPQLTHRQIKELNRKAQLSNAFVEEREEQEEKKFRKLLTKRQVLTRVPVTYPTI